MRGLLDLPAQIPFPQLPFPTAGVPREPDAALAISGALVSASWDAHEPAHVAARLQRVLIRCEHARLEAVAPRCHFLGRVHQHGHVSQIEPLGDLVLVRVEQRADGRVELRDHLSLAAWQKVGEGIPHPYVLECGLAAIGTHHPRSAALDIRSGSGCRGQLPCQVAREQDERARSEREGALAWPGALPAADPVAGSRLRGIRRPNEAIRLALPVAVVKPAKVHTSEAPQGCDVCQQQRRLEEDVIIHLADISSLAEWRRDNGVGKPARTPQ
mmetsp:Transcript_72020/g.197206  ORF Transcript_72020/g.197206 Transcript_72020/m.197206 type:complete len:271 (+) Transcript_72020:167-979(+)|eukprot:2659968-Prymnesium_polylepis.2